MNPRVRTVSSGWFRSNTQEVGGPPKWGVDSPRLGRVTWLVLLSGLMWFFLQRGGCSCAACQDFSLFLDAFPRPGVLALHVDPMSPLSRNQLSVE